MSIKNVLSLFDGIALARVALNKAGFKIEKYYASEIDMYANYIAKKNWPEHIYLGNVKAVTKKKVGKIDLLIGGSPCQDLSIAKKNRKGLDGLRSNLFYEYVRILKEVKPKYFILENVASMAMDQQEIISKTLGVKPIMIDAGLLSAQSRKRLFWTNIKGIQLPDDKGIMLRDIVNVKADRKWQPKRELRKTRTGVAWDSSGKGYASMQDRAYPLDGKMCTIPTSRAITKVNVLFDDGRVGVLNWDEMEKLQGIPVGYTRFVNQIEIRGAVIGNGFNVDVITHILKYVKK